MRINYRYIEYILLNLYILLIFVMNFTPPYILVILSFILLEFIRVIYEGKIIITSYIVIQFLFILYNAIYLYSRRSVNQEISVNAFETILFNFVINFFIIQWLYKDIEDLDQVIKNIIWFAVITCVFILLYTKGQGIDGRLAHGYPKPFFHNVVPYNSIDIAVIATYGCLFSIYYYYKIKVKKYFIFIPFFVLITVLSGSRKALVFLLLGSFVLVYIMQGQKSLCKKVKIVILSVFVVISLITLIMTNETLYKVVGQRFEGYINGILTGKYTESSANSRHIMHETAISLASKEPLLGYGLDTFRTFEGSFGTWSHNNFLELVVSGGVLVTIIYYIYHIYITVKLFKIRNKAIINKLFLLLIVFITVMDYITVTYLNRTEQLLMAMCSVLVADDTLKSKKKEVLS